MIAELCAVLACILLMCALLEAAKSDGERGRRQYRGLLALFSLAYLAAVLYFTVASGGRGRLGGVRTKVDLIILRSILTGSYRKTTHLHVLNVLMLAPFGYLAPQYGRLSWWKLLLLGAAFSLLIESFQLVFHFGVFQVDDLIDNTLGALLGWLLYAILQARGRKKPARRPENRRRRGKRT